MKINCLPTDFLIYSFIYYNLDIVCIKDEIKIEIMHIKEFCNDFS